MTDLKRQIAANAEEQKATEVKINNLSQGQERIRKNLESLNRVSGQTELVQRYAGQLAQFETQIAAQRDHQSEICAKEPQLHAALEDRIAKMAF
jgi:flagellar biosynthesis chaperone FliJ